MDDIAVNFLLQAVWLIIPLVFVIASYQANVRHPGPGPSCMVWGAGFSLLSAVVHYILNTRLQTSEVDYGQVSNYYMLINLAGIFGQGLFLYGLFIFINQRGRDGRMDRMDY